EQVVAFAAASCAVLFSGDPGLFQETAEFVDHGDAQGAADVEGDGGGLVVAGGVQYGRAYALGQGGDGGDGGVDAFLEAGFDLLSGADAVVGDSVDLAHGGGVVVCLDGPAGEGHHVGLQACFSLGGDDAVGAYGVADLAVGQCVGDHVQDSAGDRFVGGGGAFGQVQEGAEGSAFAHHAAAGVVGPVV